MSETPRTDALPTRLTVWAADDYSAMQNLARTLERELAAIKSAELPGPVVFLHTKTHIDGQEKTVYSASSANPWQDNTVIVGSVYTRQPLYGPALLARCQRVTAELTEIRDALAGTDYASLPSDFPTVRMAHTIRAERDKFMDQVRHTCTRAEKAEAERDARREDAERYRDALVNISEYWNRDNNEKAMEDACWHAINTAEAAIDAAAEGKK